MKPRHAALHLRILLSLAAGLALLLWSRSPQSQTLYPANAPLKNEAPASYSDASQNANALSGKATQEKACCDKPPTRAALMQAAPSTVPRIP